jgi:hypothetical protein
MRGLRQLRLAQAAKAQEQVWLTVLSVPVESVATTWVQSSDNKRAMAHPMDSTNAAVAKHAKTTTKVVADIEGLAGDGSLLIQMPFHRQVVCEVVVLPF